MCELIGRYATLNTPYMGYSRVEIVGREGLLWTVTICGSGKILNLYRDEFELE